MSRTEVDVIVVGAGPAGSVTARLLARAGHEVVLLDRRSFPRSKPCGDCLSAQTAPLLDRLGLLSAVERCRPARLRGWRIVAPDGSAFAAGFRAAAGGDPRVETALALPRLLLDQALLEGAVAEGVEFRPAVHATGLLRDRRDRVAGIAGRDDEGAPLALRARLVVGADGLRSVVARRLGLLRRAPRLRKLSLSAHVEVPDFEPVGEMHLAEGACAGLAPVSAESPLVNLTLVVRSARHAREVADDAEAFFWSRLERFPRLAARLGLPARAPELRRRLRGPLLASGPFDWPTRDVVVDGAALVGDAAGYYDPFTGQGVFHALATAEMLAEEADAALRAGDPSARRLRGYARRRARLVGPARRLQQLIEFVTARPALARLAVRRLDRVPAAAEAIVAATGDLRSPASLLSPGLLLSLMLAPNPREATR